MALPNYRSIFNGHISPIVKRELRNIRNSVPEERIHLAQDRAFFYRSQIYSGDERENVKISLAFQLSNIVWDIEEQRPEIHRGKKELDRMRLQTASMCLNSGKQGRYSIEETDGNTSQSKAKRRRENHYEIKKKRQSKSFGAAAEQGHRST